MPQFHNYCIARRGMAAACSAALYCTLLCVVLFHQVSLASTDWNATSRIDTVMKDNDFPRPGRHKWDVKCADDEEIAVGLDAYAQEPLGTVSLKWAWSSTFRSFVNISPTTLITRREFLTYRCQPRAVETPKSTQPSGTLMSDP